MNSLKRFDEFLGLNGWHIDYFIDVLAVTVCIGCGDVNEGLKVVHLLGQTEELLCGNHIQLDSVSVSQKEKSRLFYRRVSLFCIDIVPADFQVCLDLLTAK